MGKARRGGGDGRRVAGRVTGRTGDDDGRVGRLADQSGRDDRRDRVGRVEGDAAGELRAVEGHGRGRDEVGAVDGQREPWVTGVDALGIGAEAGDGRRDVADEEAGAGRRGEVARCVAISCFKPGVSSERLLNVAMPFASVTWPLAVGVSVPLPEASDSETTGAFGSAFPLASTPGTGFPPASRSSTVTAGVMIVLGATLVGCCTNAMEAGAPAVTAKGWLAAGGTPFAVAVRDVAAPDLVNAEVAEGGVAVGVRELGGRAAQDPGGRGACRWRASERRPTR